MFKQIKWSSLLISFVYIIAGALMFLFPSVSADTLSVSAGTALCICGIIELIVYFTMNVRETLYRNEFIIAIMSLLGAVLLFVKRDILMDLLPVVMGTAIVLSGFMKLQKGVVSVRIGYENYLPYLLIASVSIAAGIAVIFFLEPNVSHALLFRITGVSLAYSGITDVITTMFLAGRFNVFVQHYEEALSGNKESQTETISEPSAESAEASDTADVKTEETQNDEESGQAEA